MRNLIISLAVLAALSGAGCSKTPTAPTSTTTTAGTDSFSSILNVGGTATRTFMVPVRGVVQGTLAATSPQNMAVGFMIGVPRANGTGCIANVSLTTEASGTPQISVVADPGSFCAQVYDVGTLREPLSFTLTIAHP